MSQHCEITTTASIDLHSVGTGPVVQNGNPVARRWEWIKQTGAMKEYKIEKTKTAKRKTNASVEVTGAPF